MGRGYGQTGGDCVIVNTSSWGLKHRSDGIPSRRGKWNDVPCSGGADGFEHGSICEAGMYQKFKKQVCNVYSKLLMLLFN